MATSFPNVPNVPGVPPLVRNPNVPPIPPPPFLTADSPSVLSDPSVVQWGLFKDGVSVVEDDSVNAVDYQQNWTVSNYPVEPNAFQSYDKVNTPFESRVRFACGGSTSFRAAFLQSIATISGTTDLFDLATPEVVYQNVNVKGYDYSRTAGEGLGLLLVDVSIIEIRVTGTQKFSNTKAPSGAGTTNGGTVQTSAPTQNQSALSSVVN